MKAAGQKTAERSAANPPSLPAGWLFGDKVASAAENALTRSALDFAGKRAADEIKVRVINPDPAEACVTVVETLARDGAFLVETVLSVLSQFGLDPILVSHPILRVRRDSKGRMTQAVGSRENAESFVHVQIERIESEPLRTQIEREIRLGFSDAQIIARDQLAMWQRINEAIAACDAGVKSEEVLEARRFLEWMLAGNFVVMGVRTYRHVHDNEGGRLEGLYDIGFGILRDPARGVLLEASNPYAYTQDFRSFLRDPAVVAINKSGARSRVGRHVEMDYIAVRIPDATGAIRGELKILGLFAPDVYTAPIRDVPILNRRAKDIIAKSELDVNTHSGKTLIRILEEYPRDELFQMDDGEILRRALDILPLYSLPRIRAIVRADRFARFASVIVFVPRDRYDSDLRRSIGAYLEHAFGGRLTEFTPAFPHGAALARVRFLITLNGALPEISEADIEAEISRLAQTWAERLAAQLREIGPPGEGALRGGRYKSAFGGGYRELFEPQDAIVDIGNMEKLTQSRHAVFRFFPADSGQLALKIYARAEPMALSKRVPMLDAMGFIVVSERTYEISPAGCGRVWLHDMKLARIDGSPIDLELAPLLENLLESVIAGDAESDLYNALALEASLRARDIALLRALSRYLHQTGIPFSQDYMAQVAVRHADIVSSIVRLFYARFHPEHDQNGRAAAEAAIAALIEQRLGDVDSLDDDRILRRFVNLVQTCVRTNFFQIDERGHHRDAIALKFDASMVAGLPEPRPLFEIFVAGARVEGVHMRFGKVARGGLRWSDRPEDYRTEVAGLVKAQQVKNAVIVPVGAKGGFVAKHLPSPENREAWLTEGTAAYCIFISSLLDVTDNVIDGRIVSPRRTVCHDAEDPYLVVAADKGTATFSDTANAIAVSRGFWLGDAFASGGSAGYDHKKMGITARGAWEAVKRHFRELGTDIQTTPFSLAGVGDMSGDVFGNAMLLSKQIRLVAAFDHRHIFIDPEPDVAASWTERKRLFGLPRSSWADYDASLISDGGGVYPRAAKKVGLSAKAAALLGLSGPTSPHDVISAILKLDVDLLYFGGIGTYVCASDESNAEAGDRANDSVRIYGRDVRAKVVGEGANLGLTQRGRVEAALNGVRLNTDAIDNSAGVNASDYEVNIKIAFAELVASGGIALKARNALLASITDDVAARVLANNYSQTLALSWALVPGHAERDLCRRLMQTLEGIGTLARAIEFLPDEAELDRRTREGAGLTRPELAVLLAYAKNTFYEQLIGTTALDDPYFDRELAGYFPSAMLECAGIDIENHPLRREIVATRITNSLIDLGGFEFAMRAFSSADAPGVARAFVTVRDAFRMDDLVASISALDLALEPSVQIGLYQKIRRFLIAQAASLQDAGAIEDNLADTITRYRDAADLFRTRSDLLAPPGIAALVARETDALLAVGVPEPLARELGCLDIIAVALDAVVIAGNTGANMEDSAKQLLFALDSLGAFDFRTAALSLPVSDKYEMQLRDQAITDLMTAARTITLGALKTGEAVEIWIRDRASSEDIKAALTGACAEPSLARLSIVADGLLELARS